MLAEVAQLRLRIPVFLKGRIVINLALEQNSLEFVLESAPLLKQI